MGIMNHSTRIVTRYERGPFTLSATGKPKRTKAKRQAKVFELLQVVYENQPDLKRNDSGAAREILKIVNELKPKELILKPSGTVLGPDAIKRHIVETSFILCWTIFWDRKYNQVFFIFMVIPFNFYFACL